MYFYIILAIIIFFLYLIRKYMNGPIFNKKADLSWKTIIVTGASAGIGKETAFDLLENGANVVFACRDEKKTRQVISTIKNPESRSRARFMKLDLCSVDSIVRFIKEFKNIYLEDLDMLINNAGLVEDSFRLCEGIEVTMMANHIGHKILTLLLLDKFNIEEARIINLSSDAHSSSNYTLDELKRLENNLSFVGEGEGYGIKKSFTQYGNTKLANIWFNQYLYDKLASSHSHIKVAAVHPGVVNTEFSRVVNNYSFWIRYLIWVIYPIFWLLSKSPYVGAQSVFSFVYEDFDKLESGIYIKNNVKSKISWKARNEEMRDEFMKYSWMLVDKVTKGKVTLKKL